MHIIDALAGYAWIYLLTLFFDVQHKRQKAFNISRRDVVAIRTLYKGFALEIQNRDETGHGE